MSFQWDPNKEAANVRKHGVRFDEATAVLTDSYALTVEDTESDPREQRFVALGMGATGRLLTVVYCHAGDEIRIISARLAGRAERELYEEKR